MWDKLKRVLLLLIALPVVLLAQDSTSYFPRAQHGISIEYGQGSYAVKDQYISNEKYSGTLPFYEVSWNRYHESYQYLLQIEYRNSSNIDNHNVSTDITQFSINQSFVYPVLEFSLWNKPAKFFLGPSTEIFIFSNDQQIAVAGFDYAQSYALLLSVGINSQIVNHMSPKFQLESSLEFTALSLGMRIVDSDEDDQSPVKLLSIFTGLNSTFTIGFRYKIINHLSVKLAYNFEMIRISSWEPLYSASDNLVLQLRYKF